MKDTPNSPLSGVSFSIFRVRNQKVRECNADHEKLAALRTEKGLSQQELAELLHIACQSVSRWEVGDAVPSVENLRFLARLYGVTVDSLLDDDAAPIHKDAPPSPPKYLTRRALCALLAVLLILLAAVGILLWQRHEEKNPTPLQFEGLPSESWDGLEVESTPIIW